MSSPPQHRRSEPGAARPGTGSGSANGPDGGSASQRIAIAIVVLLGIAGLAWLLWGRGTPTPPPETEAADPGIDPAEIVARKMRARRGGAIDLSPARARGRVTTIDGGRPIAGAVVLLTPKGVDRPSRAISPGQTVHPLQTRTDADGGWTLPAVPAGRYTLSAAARGYLPATRTDVTLRAGEDNGGLDLALGPGGHELRGSVSDIMGGPVEGVLVRVMRVDDARIFDFDRHTVGAVTDDEGRFVVQLTDGRYEITTFHVDYVPATESLRIDGGPRTVAIEVIPAGSIAGRVLARDTGAPIEGALVARTAEQAGSILVQGAGDDQVMTDAAGRFVLRGLNSGVVRLHASARGYATQQPVEVVLGVAEEVSGVEILVDAARTVSGFVVAQGDEDRGLQGVLIGAYSVDPPRLFAAAAPSAADGYFEIFGVLPGAYTVAAIGEDALPNFFGSRVEVGQGDVDDVLVVMNAGAHVRGRVSPAVPARISIEVDPTGVSIVSMLETMSNALVRTRTDDEGGFDLHPVAQGSVRLVAEADDGSRGSIPIEVGTGDLEGLVIPLQPRASVRGQVIDASGAPGAGLTVTFRPKARPRPAGAALEAVGGGPDQASTDASGNFVVKGLDAGDYEVTVATGRGPGPTLEWARPVDPEHPRAPIVVHVEQAERREGLVLEVEARDGRLTGVVVGPDGAPVPDVWVTAVRNDSVRQWLEDGAGPGLGPMPSGGGGPADQALQRFESQQMAEPPALTDLSGRFEIDGLRRGTYRLQAEAPKDGLRGYLDPVTPDAEVTVVLRPLAGLEGVVQQAGAPVAAYTVTADGPTRRQQQIHAPDGRFAMARLDPGVYAVTASSADGVARAEVEIGEGQTPSITLEIGGWGTLRGLVIDATTGDPLSDLAITVVGEDGTGAGSMMGVLTGAGPTTDAQGRFAVDEVPPGEGTLMFFDRDAAGMGGIVAQVPYVIEAEEDHDLGTITGVAASYIRPEDRGALGLLVRVATYADRPRAPMAVDDQEEAAFDRTPRLWVSYVTPRGPAARQGLVPGDEVLSIEGTTVLELGALNAAKLLSPQQLQLGDGVWLEIEHGGASRSVRLVAQPPEDGGR